jgi:gamma-glutamyltranspeptidase/glutathione hydrolase
MVSSPSAFATVVGVDLLRSGGNAVDAALAVSAALMVSAPHQSGPGGDGWWLVARPGEDPVVLNATGESGSAADATSLLRQGHQAAPRTSAVAVTVPGAIAGWAEVHGRYASRDLRDLLEPAIVAARDGLPVTPYVARQLAAADDLLASRPATDAIYRPGGHCLRPGDRLVLGDLATTLETIARDQRAIYEGRIAELIVEALHSEGGWLTADDLADASATWEDPLAGDFGGWAVWEAPPNSQGITVLISSGIGRRLGLLGPESSADGPRRRHQWIEAARIALAVRDLAVGDPRSMSVAAESLLEPSLLESLCALVRPAAAPEPELRAEVAEVLAAVVPRSTEQPPERTGNLPNPLARGDGDTVHFAVVDRDGLAVSAIQSLLTPFGTGIAVPGTGIVLHNRGTSFALESGHPNALEPRRRPLHTLAPAMAFAAGGLAAAFGCMGGHAQAQLQLQILDGLVWEGLDPASVTERARWFARTDEAGQEELLIEQRGSEADDLRRLGHRVRLVGPYDELMGHQQIVAVDRELGVLVGAADPRTDGLVLGF